MTYLLFFSVILPFFPGKRDELKNITNNLLMHSKVANMLTNVTLITEMKQSSAPISFVADRNVCL